MEEANENWLAVIVIHNPQNNMIKTIKKYCIVGLFSFAVCLTVMPFVVNAQDRDIVECGGRDDMLNPTKDIAVSGVGTIKKENLCYYPAQLKRTDTEGTPTGGQYSLIRGNTPLVEQCTSTHFFGLLHRIIDIAIFNVAPALVVAMLVIGGILIMVSGGSTGVIAPGGTNPVLGLYKAKQMIQWAFIGYIVILIAWLLVNTFLDAIGVAQWTNIQEQWNVIQIEERKRPIIYNNNLIVVDKNKDGNITCSKLAYKQGTNCNNDNQDNDWDINLRPSTKNPNPKEAVQTEKGLEIKVKDENGNIVSKLIDKSSYPWFAFRDRNNNYIDRAQTDECKDKDPNNEQDKAYLEKNCYSKIRFPDQYDSLYLLRECVDGGERLPNPDIPRVEKTFCTSSQVNITGDVCQNQSVDEVACGREVNAAYQYCGNIALKQGKNCFIPSRFSTQWDALCRSHFQTNNISCDTSKIVGTNCGDSLEVCQCPDGTTDGCQPTQKTCVDMSQTIREGSYVSGSSVGRDSNRQAPLDLEWGQAIPFRPITSYFGSPPYRCQEAEASLRSETIDQCSNREAPNANAWGCHRGIDFGAGRQAGTRYSVRAITDGVLMYDENEGSFGKHAKLSHATDGYESWYAHLAQFSFQCKELVIKPKCEETTEENPACERIGTVPGFPTLENLYRGLCTQEPTITTRTCGDTYEVVGTKQARCNDINITKNRAYNLEPSSIAEQDFFITEQGRFDRWVNGLLENYTEEKFNANPDNYRYIDNPQIPVEKGDIIGYVGGSADSDHLHLEVWRKGRRVDYTSLPTIPERKKWTEDYLLDPSRFMNIPNNDNKIHGLCRYAEW